jgi:hypothetical protein
MEMEYIIWPIVGIVVIIGAVVLRKKLEKSMDISANVERYGLKILGVDGFGLFLIIGVLLIGYGPYLQWSNEKERITSLESKLASLDETIQAMKEFDFAFKLKFPNAEIVSDAPDIGVFVKKKGGRNFSAYDVFDWNPTPGDLTVSVKNLRQGDFLYFVVSDDQKSWQSEIVQIPTGSVLMKAN